MNFNVSKYINKRGASDDKSIDITEEDFDHDDEFVEELQKCGAVNDVTFKISTGTTSK